MRMKSFESSFQDSRGGWAVFQGLREYAPPLAMMRASRWDLGFWRLGKGNCHRSGGSRLVGEGVNRPFRTLTGSARWVPRVAQSTAPP